MVFCAYNGCVCLIADLQPPVGFPVHALCCGVGHGGSAGPTAVFPSAPTLTHAGRGTGTCRPRTYSRWQATRSSGWAMCGMCQRGLSSCPVLASRVMAPTHRCARQLIVCPVCLQLSCWMQHLRYWHGREPAVGLRLDRSPQVEDRQGLPNPTRCNLSSAGGLALALTACNRFHLPLPLTLTRTRSHPRQVACLSMSLAQTTLVKSSNGSASPSRLGLCL